MELHGFFSWIRVFINHRLQCSRLSRLDSVLKVALQEKIIRRDLKSDEMPSIIEMTWLLNNSCAAFVSFALNIFRQYITNLRFTKSHDFVRVDDGIVRKWIFRKLFLKRQMVRFLSVKMILNFSLIFYGFFKKKKISFFYFHSKNMTRNSISIDVMSIHL